MATDLGHLQAILGLDTSRFMRGINSVRNKLNNISRQMQATGKAMTLALTLPLAILGGTAVKTFADFEKAMNQVKAVSQATEVQMAQLEKTARHLGSTTKFTATQAAEGMNFLSMAGFSVKEVLDAMPATLNLAAAGNMELARAADHVSNIMQGFGIEASRTAEVTDILTATFTKSNTSLEQLGDAMSYAAPAASALGQSIDTVSAAIGFLSDAGIQSTRAGTGMRQIFTQLIRKSGELGITLTDAFGKFYDLADIMEQVEKQGLTAAEVFEIMGPRAGTAMVTLLKRGSAELRKFSAQVAASGGITERVANTQMEGLSGAFIELKSALQEVAISFSETFAGAIEGFVDKVKVAAQWVGNLDDRTKRITIAVIAFVAAIGPAILIIGKLIALFVALSSPITAVVAGVVALGIAILYIVDNWEALKERITDWGWWKNILISMAQFFLRYNPWSLMIDAWNYVSDQFKKTDLAFWKNLLVRMIKLAIEYNPFNILLKAGNIWIKIFGKLFGMAEAATDTFDELSENVKDIGEDGEKIRNPFEKWALGLDSLRVGTKEYNHEFESIADFIERRSKDLGDALAGLIPKGGGGGGIANLPQVPKMRGQGSGLGWAYAGVDKTALPAMDRLIAKQKEVNRIVAEQGTAALKEFEAELGGVSMGAGLVGSAFQGMSNVISNALQSTENIFQAFWKFFVDFIKGLIIKLVAAMIAAVLLAIALKAIGVPTKGLGSIKEGMSFGKTIMAGFKDLSGLKTGGFVTDGGLFRVGEAGPEIVSLPAGSAVTPANMSKQMVAGSGGGLGTMKLAMRKFIIEEDKERKRLRS